MLENEFVTFSQNFLDRCGNLRSNQKKINDYLCNDSAKFLIYWRGKIPIISDTGDKLCLVGREHPLVLNYSGTPIFLGFESGIPFFSIDISSWLPESYNDEAARTFFDPNVYNHPDLPEKQRTQGRRLCTGRPGFPVPWYPLYEGRIRCAKRRHRPD